MLLRFTVLVLSKEKLSPNDENHTPEDKGDVLIVLATSSTQSVIPIPRILKGLSIARMK